MLISRTKFSPVVVAPTYDNAATLRDVIAPIARLGLPVIVVNDGSTDATGEILEQLRREFPGIQVATHTRNCGKAAALRTGFALAGAEGYTHAVTIDTDGQLDPAETPKFLDAARSSPQALVVGVRDDSAADYPARSRTGRRVSNLFVRLESGLRVADSQCGFRVYPLDFVSYARCRAGRYAFETEILTRAGWAGCEVVEVPVSCRYLPEGERVSHFRPWMDSFRAVGLHARLVGRALVPIPHAKWGRQQRGHVSRVRRILDWLNPARLIRDVREQRLGAHETATGVAVGVFIGNLPIYGLQTVVSLYTARRLHLHPLPVVAGSHVSTPPLGPVLIAVAVGVGHWLLHGSWLKLPRWHATWQEWTRLVGNLLLEWSVGSLLVGFVLALIAFALSRVLLAYVVPPPVARD
jgi:glycosyltransferase involved in cell wall biosynthesis